MTAAQLFGFLAALLATAVFADTNIDSIQKYSWSENAGWMNWRDAGQPIGTQGGHIGGTILAGFVWAENVGWVNLGDGSPANGEAYANVNGTDFGVNVKINGDLFGMAWGENIGWINFDGGALASPPAPVYIDCDGRLYGYAWAENVGWIDLSETEAGKFVAVDSDSTPYACDMNHDGSSDGRDVQPFVDVLLTGGEDWLDICSGDNEPSPDDLLDIDDVPAFVACLLN